jgi:hypothetical protein
MKFRDYINESFMQQFSKTKSSDPAGPGGKTHKRQEFFKNEKDAKAHIKKNKIKGGVVVKHSAGMFSVETGKSADFHKKKGSVVEKYLMAEAVFDGKAKVAGSFVTLPVSAKDADSAEKMFINKLKGQQKLGHLKKGKISDVTIKKA